MLVLLVRVMNLVRELKEIPARELSIMGTGVYP